MSETQKLSRRAIVKRIGQASLVMGIGANLSACSLFEEAEALVGLQEELRNKPYLVVLFNRKKFLIRQEGDKLVAINLTCRHKKCTVKYKAALKQFHCPCHEGIYDEQGYVVEGPPPGPLYRYKIEQRGEEVWLLNERL